jgi:hypothetical protein
MLWVTWRQFRIQAIAAMCIFAGLAVVLVFTAPHLLHLYHVSGIAACQATNGDCGPLIDDFTSHYRLLHGLSPLIVLIPGIVGVFWGAPLLAREIETGTFRLAWTQSVTRTRWLVVKLLVVGGASVLVTIGFEALIAWWSGPIDKVSANRFAPAMFDQRGLAPGAYAAFAFAIGVLLGAVIRRVLPAMAATVAAVAAVRFVVQDLIRPHFAAANHVTAPIFTDGGTALGSGVWVVSRRVVNAAGNTIQVRRDVLRNLCGLPEGRFSRDALAPCAQRLGIHQILAVQPADRYWPFQTWEALIFVALAAIAIGLSFWWVRSRLN